MHLLDLTMFYPAITGGVGTYLGAKARWLARHTPIRHTIVAPMSPRAPRAANVTPIAGFPLPGSHGYRLPLSMRQARRVVERLHPDLIECSDPYQCAWSSLHAGRHLGVPVVGFYHSDLPSLVGQRFGQPARRLATRYVARLYRQFDLVLAPSMVMVERLRDLGIQRAMRQPLGVDTEVFNPRRAAPKLREHLGLPGNARLLVYAGRFTREKHLPLLLEAMRRLGAPFHLLLIGSGPRLAPMERVIQFPFQSEPGVLASLIGACDMLVHPGDQETFGMVLLEAMACGVPVLAMAAGAVPELVDADCGMLVAPRSVEALTQGIADLARRDLRAMGQCGRNRMLRQYDWDVVMPQLVQHYSRLLADERRGRHALENGYAIR
ncbi:glycosyltransferase family 1 protein|uniref:glycosyltransferase family 4 protein n=1 Tax=Noviherbaspirillum sp. L7-7A TaxID=2850560 RepID=UPI001C2B96ED|nr:glycosyltransferase family 1 protein [Noviherbaspirillum sp. L7-7A]MBV0879594.1 glycosyltransferase family 1 protein [Noviherbaspirillum sp. L7-7A]